MDLKELCAQMEAADENQRRHHDVYVNHREAVAFFWLEEKAPEPFRKLHAALRDASELLGEMAPIGRRPPFWDTDDLHSHVKAAMNLLLQFCVCRGQEEAEK